MTVHYKVKMTDGRLLRISADAEREDDLKDWLNYILKQTENQDGIMMVVPDWITVTIEGEEECM